jgi:tetraacyldisaccharide 4'-kinase
VSWQQTLLAPLSPIYEAISRLRVRAYRSKFFATHKLPSRVVSVGNLTTGGTGKTPMVLWIAERLAASGKSVGILTRGYRGSGSTSDEVRLLQSRLPSTVKFGVGANRFEQGSALAQQGVDWFVLDDGFQHLKLARDVNVLLIDAANPFGGGKLLPAGRLREPRSAMSRADAIVITRSEHAPAIESAIRLDSSAPIFYSQAKLDGLFSAETEAAATAAPPSRESKWFAFCGVGNPEAFAADLKQWGFAVAGKRVFKDHHAYTQAELDEIALAAERAGAAHLVCTEKDKFNLPSGARGRLPIFYCRISMRVDREADLMRLILGDVPGAVK